MSSSNIFNKEIKLPKLPKLPNKYEVPFTRFLLVVYSLFALAYLISFWYGVARDTALENIFNGFFLIFELGILYIIFSILLLFGLIQNFYAALIINKKRMKAREHSLIGTILSSISLLYPVIAMLVSYENFYPLLSIIWLLLTIALFIQIIKLRKE